MEGKEEDTHGDVLLLPTSLLFPSLTSICPFIFGTGGVKTSCIFFLHLSLSLRRGWKGKT